MSRSLGNQVPTTKSQSLTGPQKTVKAKQKEARKEDGADAKLSRDQVDQLLQLAGRASTFWGIFRDPPPQLPGVPKLLAAAAKHRPGFAPIAGGSNDLLSRVLAQQTQILCQLATSARKSHDSLHPLASVHGLGKTRATSPPTAECGNQDELLSLLSLGLVASRQRTRRGTPGWHGF